MAGIKETQEAMEGILGLGLVMYKIFGDGVQFEDFSKVMDVYKNDVEFMAKLEKAHQGYENIPAELADLDGAEVAVLASTLIGYLPQYIEALKKS
jgi:hypothetical protein